MKQFNLADLIQLKVGRNIWGHCDVLNEEETFVEKCISLMNNRNKVWKILFLSVKSRGMLKKDVCVYYETIWRRGFLDVILNNY